MELRELLELLERTELRIVASDDVVVTGLRSNEDWLPTIDDLEWCREKALVTYGEPPCTVVMTDDARQLLSDIRRSEQEHTD